jgi:phytanoyl-CoA hydroxylase
MNFIAHHLPRLKNISNQNLGSYIGELLLRTSDRLVCSQASSHHRNKMAAYGWNPQTNPAPENASWVNQTVVHWPAEVISPDQWLHSIGGGVEALHKSFLRDSFLVLRKLMPLPALQVYQSLYLTTLNELETPGRHDLGAHKPTVLQGIENVGQIQWPTDLVENSREGPLHARGYAIARALVGDDAAFDFDMLIWKAGQTLTETPWHQDEAYWPSGMNDKRALTVWCALDEVTVDNGALWFISGSQDGPLLPHAPAAPGSHILSTSSVSEASRGATPVPLAAGDCVCWGGRTAHFARGNKTPRTRRAFIANFRPESMVSWERQHGFDHLRHGFDDYRRQKNAAGDAYKAEL